MRKSMIFFLLLLSSIMVQAQPMSKASADQQVKAAEDRVQNNDPYQALKYYQEVYKETKDREVYYTIAKLNYELRDYNRAARSYERIVSRKYRDGPNPFLPHARFEFARILKMQGNYSEAVQQFQTFISEEDDLEKIKLAKTEIQGCEMALEMDPISGMAIENVGPNVNSKYSEYSPVLINDKEMFFTGINSKKVIILGETDKGKKAVDPFSKVYSSTRQGDGWTKAEVTGGKNIHRVGYHVGNLTVTDDGKLMYFTRVVLDGNKMKESKLYVSQRNSEGWGAAAEVKGINGDYIVKQPSLGELYGKDVMFFVSDMEGGYGGFDLYYATRTDEGFSNPTNMGAVLNTAADDETPHYIEGRIYFSSTGHAGIGGFDIFTSTWNGSSWSPPANMGTPYNSSVDDLYFSIDKDGYAGFLVSNRPGTNSVKSPTCCNDIYSITKQNIVIDLLANTLTTENKTLNGVNVELIVMEEDKPGVTDRRSKENDNKYTFNLSKDVAYMLVGTKDGYESDTLTFNTVGIRKSEQIARKLKLKYVPPKPKEPEYVEITTENPIRLNNIYYDFDDDKILADAEPDLTFLMTIMSDYPEMVIELQSHTDAQGTTPYNRKLSQRRADSARSWLLERGISEDRIQAKGYGESEILNRCVNGVRCPDDEHRFNRRTVFKILSGPTVIRVKKKVLNQTTGSEESSGQKKNK